MYSHDSKFSKSMKRFRVRSLSPPPPPACLVLTPLLPPPGQPFGIHHKLLSVLTGKYKLCFNFSLSLIAISHKMYQLYTLVSPARFSRVRLCATVWTMACRALLSTGFSRQEYWSGLPHPPPGNLPNPGLNLRLLHLLHWQVCSLPPVPLGKSLFTVYLLLNHLITVLDDLEFFSVGVESTGHSFSQLHGSRVAGRGNPLPGPHEWAFIKHSEMNYPRRYMC